MHILNIRTILLGLAILLINGHSFSAAVVIAADDQRVRINGDDWELLKLACKKVADFVESAKKDELEASMRLLSISSEMLSSVIELLKAARGQGYFQESASGDESQLALRDFVAQWLI